MPSRSVPARAALLACALLGAGCAGPSPVARSGGASFTPEERAAAARVTAEEIAGHIRFLSDDLLEGRFPGTRGSEIAIRHLASELEARRPPGWGKEQRELFERRDYHRRTDTYSPETWDLGGALEDAQLQLVVGLRVANAPGLPTWTPGDEFERARAQAQK